MEVKSPAAESEMAYFQGVASLRICCVCLQNLLVGSGSSSGLESTWMVQCHASLTDTVLHKNELRALKKLAKSCLHPQVTFQIDTWALNSLRYFSVWVSVLFVCFLNEEAAMMVCFLLRKSAFSRNLHPLF